MRPFRRRRPGPGRPRPASRPQLTDSLARQAAADPAQNVTYPGQFHLTNSQVVSDGCHANTAGQAALGNQALAFWG